MTDDHQHFLIRGIKEGQGHGLIIVARTEFGEPNPELSPEENAKDLADFSPYLAIWLSRWNATPPGADPWVYADHSVIYLSDEEAVNLIGALQAGLRSKKAAQAEQG